MCKRHGGTCSHEAFAESIQVLRPTPIDRLEFLVPRRYATERGVGPMAKKVLENKAQAENIAYTPRICHTNPHCFATCNICLRGRGVISKLLKTFLVLSLLCQIVSQVTVSTGFWTWLLFLFQTQGKEFFFSEIRAATLQKCGSEIFLRFSLPKVSWNLGVKFGWNFPCYVFQGLGVRRKISPKFHVKIGVKNGKFHANFTLQTCSADRNRRHNLGTETWTEAKAHPSIALKTHSWKTLFPWEPSEQQTGTAWTGPCTAIRTQNLVRPLPSDTKSIPYQNNSLSITYFSWFWMDCLPLKSSGKKRQFQGIIRILPWWR